MSGGGALTLTGLLDQCCKFGARPKKVTRGVHWIDA